MISFNNKIFTAIREFTKKNFEVTSTKRSRLIGAIVSAVLLLIVIIDHKAFTTLQFSSKWILLGVAMIIPFIIGITIAYRINILNDKINKIWHFLIILLMPFPAITMSEALNRVFIYNMTYLGFFGNYMLMILLYFAFFAATGSIKVPFLVVHPIIFGLAVAHSYIVDFRGTPFIPMDFLSITTAVGVAGTYSYTLTYNVLIAALLFIWMMIFSIKIVTPKYNLITKISSRVFCGSFFAVIMILFYGTSVFADMGIRPDFWNQSRGYHNYGFSFMFFCNTKYLYMSEPSGYDPDKVGDYIQHIVDKPQEEPDNDTDDNSNKPNIICIMNESLADLSVLGEFTTNEDYMPFLRSLTENTIKGNTYVPVIGAGTSNSEFEFLTGHSTAFLPSGSNAYMLYIKKPLASLVSTLEGQNYSSYTMHPYYEKGWNRLNVYNNMGFDLFDTIEDLLIPDMMYEYSRNGSDPDYLQSMADIYYPGTDLLLRQYISDSYNYDVLIENYENRDKSKPYFAFNVTMQNHGGYTTPALNFNEEIYVTSSSTSYEKVNRYLSLVKRSDEAFKELVDYFSNVKEPTVICMFGDHHPSVENAFISELLGVNNLSSLTIEQEQARHATPFYIWANFDIEEQYIDKLSVNYLSSLTLKTAGVKLTDYNEYLLKLMEELPVIDTVGYIDSQNNYYRWSSDSPYREKLNEYEQIQYNNIFDSGNKHTEIFYLDGYTGDEGINTQQVASEAAGK